MRTSGLDDAEKNLLRFASFIVDLRSFWPILTRKFIGWMGEQFKTEGAWGGDAWEPLAESTLAQKERLGFGNKGILVRRGGKQPGLLARATSPTRIVTPSSLILTIEGWKDAKDRDLDPLWHQDGTARMPARPLLADPLPEQAQEDIAEAAELYVDEIAVRLGF